MRGWGGNEQGRPIWSACSYISWFSGALVVDYSALSLCPLLIPAIRSSVPGTMGQAERLFICLKRILAPLRTEYAFRVPIELRVRRGKFDRPSVARSLGKRLFVSVKGPGRASCRYQDFPGSVCRPIGTSVPAGYLVYGSGRWTEIVVAPDSRVPEPATAETPSPRRRDPSCRDRWSPSDFDLGIGSYFPRRWGDLQGFLPHGRISALHGGHTEIQLRVEIVRSSFTWFQASRGFLLVALASHICAIPRCAGE